MAKLNPYLTFTGNCEEAFNYYKSIFGGDFDYVGRYSEMPPQEGFDLPASYREKIMHISLRINKETVLMGSDSGGEWAPKVIIGNNFSLSYSVESKKEADRIFKILSTDGVVTMPIESTFWGDYFGMCTDKYGINWMISFNEDHPMKDQTR